MATTTRTHATQNRATASVGRRALAGLVGGVAGGLVFGVLMAMMGMLPMIASMVGSDSALVGFGIHIVISIMIGLGLTVLFGSWLLTSYPKGVVVGLVYGAVWWVLGPLLVMPAMLGMPMFTVDQNALLSLMGHLIYGVVLAVVAVGIIAKRRRP